MNRTGRALLIAGFMAATFTACKKDSGPERGQIQGPDLDFYALSDDNKLMLMNASSAAMVKGTMDITGVESGESILSIDFRPATGQLYGLGSRNHIYVINIDNGSAHAIGAMPFSPGIDGSSASIDFNPTVDRIRLVSPAGQNLRLNPETGAVQATDGRINGVANAQIGAVAYTNSKAGASATVLYDIDIANNKLHKQDPPNDGGLVEVGDLGVDAEEMAAFDISPDNSSAIAALRVGGRNSLYRIDLNSGRASAIGELPGNVRGLAIPTEPVAYAVNFANELMIFNPMNPGTPVIKAIAGMQAGEDVIGIDFRPVNGQLYAGGSTGRLYTINASSGAATAVGSAPFAQLDGVSFGFDFNPTVDRIRLVSNTGQNLRLNPNDGTLAATDGRLNPGTPFVSGAAYTNNVAGATSTKLYVIDARAKKLFVQDPPNAGTLVEVGDLGMSVDDNDGFDIGGRSGAAWAILSMNSGGKLYRINLETGAATPTADFPASVRGFAVGLGF
ncbi:MAG: DUF4394 domain-containing protein [Mucilaginibacter polytrichastri]|nr:DUF4394 domain-containing protein [Mucilaginibacter polytrichastri]